MPEECAQVQGRDPAYLKPATIARANSTMRISWRRTRQDLAWQEVAPPPGMAKCRNRGKLLMQKPSEHEVSGHSGGEFGLCALWDRVSETLVICCEYTSSTVLGCRSGVR